MYFLDRCLEASKRLSFKPLLLVPVALYLCGPLLGQEVFGDNRPRLLLGAEIGSASALGYTFPSITVGPAVEVPFKNRFEFQATATFSPDHKLITHDGELASASGSVLVFAGQRAGFFAKMERGWLWTSQFDKAPWFPSAGLVLRNNAFGPGRLYISYIFPTGCVWATQSNPCTIQSNRLQGIVVHEETRSFDHTRLGFESGIYHFCDEGNPNDPAAGRRCHWGPTVLLLVRFEFHCGRVSRFALANSTGSDNF